MADGEQITHLCTMIHSQADSLHFATMASSGYLERLQREIKSGGFASDGTLEILALTKSEQYLRQTAAAIEKAKLQLISNYMQREKNRVIERAILSFTGGIGNAKIVASGEPF